MLVWFDKRFFLRDLSDDNRDMYNFASISRFTLQNMAGCRVLGNLMVSIFILNWKPCSTRESDSEVCDLIKAVDRLGDTS